MKTEEEILNLSMMDNPPPCEGREGCLNSAEWMIVMDTTCPHRYWLGCTGCMNEFKDMNLWIKFWQCQVDNTKGSLKEIRPWG